MRISLSTLSSGNIALRRRPEIRWQAQFARGSELILAHDPVAERDWYWRPEEWALALLIKPGCTWQELRTAWETRYAPRRITPAALQRSLAKLLDAGMLQRDDAEHLELLARRESEEDRRRAVWWQRWVSIPGPSVAIRRWTPSLQPLSKIVFSRLSLLLLLAVCCLATVIFIRHWPRLNAEVQTLWASANAWSWLTWLAMVAVIKTLHEAGHLLAAVRENVTGIRVGTLLLCGLPTLNCRVNRANELPRGGRMLINAAGMLTETALAAVGILIWSLSVPGLLHDIALQVTVLCLINTLLLNGNPLLRYDGYYLLSDGLGIPNLAQQAGNELRRFIARGLGVNPATLGPTLQSHRLVTSIMLAGYAVTSTLYRWALALGMVLMVGAALRPAGWVTPARLLGAAFLALFAVPLVTSARRAGQSLLLEEESLRRRILARGGLVLLVIIGLLLIPLPATLRVPILWEPAQGLTVSNTVPGRILEVRTPNTHVNAGDVLARLENPELLLTSERLQGDIATYMLRVDNLRRRQNDPLAAAELVTAEATLADLRERQAPLEKELNQLMIIAPHAGRWLPPPERTASSAQVTAAGGWKLGASENSWQGLPSDPRNRGAWLDTGTPLGTLAAEGTLSAQALIDQADLALVQPGQPGMLRCNALPGIEWSGTVGQIAAQPTAELSSEWLALASSQRLALESREHQGQSRATLRETSYFASFHVNSSEAIPVFGTPGTAKIELASQSLATRGWRWFARSFGWEW
jgi:putative peptide zinc metalloprotease protein